MRVIAGTLKGRRLEAPTWEGLRPTSDKLRETLFNILAARIVGARVLDGYAGTGAVGIEALSRGAASALFVEENSGAASVIERNLTRTKLEGRVRKQDVFAFLKSTQTPEPFRIIFADPPYEKTKSGGEFTRLLLESTELAGMLDGSGFFVLEKRPVEKVAPTPLWNITRAKKYGATEVLFLQRASS